LAEEVVVEQMQVSRPWSATPDVGNRCHRVRLAFLSGHDTEAAAEAATALGEAEGCGEVRPQRVIEADMVANDVFDGEGVGRIPGAADDRTGEFDLEAGNPVGGVAEYRRRIDAVIVRLDGATVWRAGQHDIIATGTGTHQREIWQRPVQLRQPHQESAGTRLGEAHAAQAQAAVDTGMMGLPVRLARSTWVIGPSGESG